MATLVAFYHTQNRSFVKAKLTPAFITVIAVLVLLIPFVLYKALKLWLEGETSPFPDIDHAWKAGLAELERQGLNPAQIPIFLILGSSGEPGEIADGGLAVELQRERSAARPRRPALVRQSRRHLHRRHRRGLPQPVVGACGGGLGAGEVAAHADRVPRRRATRCAARLSPGRAARRIVHGRFGHAAVGPACADGPRRPISAARWLSAVRPGPAISRPKGFRPPRRRKSSSSTSTNRAEQQRRLEYLCRLLRRLRQPLCPVNGVLTLLPFGLVQRSVPESIEVQRAVQRDTSDAVGLAEGPLSGHGLGGGVGGGERLSGVGAARGTRPRRGTAFRQGLQSLESAVARAAGGDGRPRLRRV